MHGDDPASIAFFHSRGFDYVSCSPSRLRVARLAAAQAGLASATEGHTAPHLSFQLSVITLAQVTL